MRSLRLLLLSIISLSAAAIGAAETQRLNLSAGDEFANKGHDIYSRANVVNATVSYSDTIAATPVFNRPNTCSGLSGTGTAVGYHVQQFSVDTTGSYSVEVLGSSTISGADSYLVIYHTAFNPASPLTNCVITDDDSGTGFYSLATTNLTAGTQYFAVTTTFSNGATGNFDNQISGPGNITLGVPGPQADLGITVTAPLGILTSGTYTYELVASNAGPDPATNTVVTSLLSPFTTFVSSTCGASNAGGIVTWNIGNLGVGGTATCVVTVSMGSACAIVEFEASIESAESDPVPANSVAVESNSAGNLVADPSFEEGTPNSSWTEVEATFGTPICDAGGCGLGGGTGAHSGDFWVWFGGLSSGPTSGSMTQSLAIPSGATTLTFWVETPVCNAANGASDFATLSIDGNELWRIDATAASCGTVGYFQVSVDVSAYANGASHTLAFASQTIGNGAVSNFFIDDVEIQAAPTCSVALQPSVPVPALDRSAIAALAILLGLLGVAASRRNIG